MCLDKNLESMIMTCTLKVSSCHNMHFILFYLFCVVVVVCCWSLVFFLYAHSYLMSLQDCYLVYILIEKCGFSSMVFTRTCYATRLVALFLRNLGFKAIPISGEMAQVPFVSLSKLYRF